MVQRLSTLILLGMAVFFVACEGNLMPPPFGTDLGTDTLDAKDVTPLPDISGDMLDTYDDADAQDLVGDTDLLDTQDPGDLLDADIGDLDTDDGDVRPDDGDIETDDGDEPPQCQQPDDCEGVVEPGPCEEIACKDGECVLEPKEDQTPCDDGTFCTRDGICVEGECIGQPIECMDDGDPCTLDICVDGEGCKHVEHNGSCDDGNACTENDNCRSGFCVGDPITCNDNNPCTDDSCDREIGCVFSANTARCDDGNDCTYNDTCSNKVCTGTAYTCVPGECVTDSVCDGQGGCLETPKVNQTPCSDDGNSCTNDVCIDGRCEHPAVTDGTACDDGNLCTQTDTCVKGVCVGSNFKVCQVEDPCRDAGGCDPATGTCSLDKLPEGAPCDDNNACTLSDFCRNNTCTGENEVVCDPPRECFEAGVCDTSTGQCDYNPVEDGTPCNDGNLCTLIDTCNMGICTGSSLKACPPPGQCELPSTCNPETGECPVQWKDNDVPCDDGDPCTLNSSCQDGVCEGFNPKCNDGIECTDDVCNLQGDCSYPVKAGWCLIAGVCWEVGAVDPSNQCMICDPASSKTAWTKANGRSCDDGDLCTFEDTCNNGFCQGQSYTCQVEDECVISTACDGLGGCQEVKRDDGTPCTDDGDICTLDQCVGGRCTHPTAPDGHPCDDDNLCTQTDTCIDGVCVGSNPKECQVEDPCRDSGACNPATGLCDLAALPEGAPCDDGNACTQNDYCRNSTCTGENPVICTASDQCHLAGTCNPVTGKCTNPKVQDGTACNDDNLCTQTDTCVDGVCQGGNPVVCDEPGECELQSTCDPTTGTCPVRFKPDNTLCDDQDPCSAEARCTAGVCQQTKPTCIDNLSCTEDVCNNGVCSFPVIAGKCLIDGSCWDSGEANPFNPCLACDPATDDLAWSHVNGIPCDDGNICTLGDTCMDGVCQGVQDDCDDGNVCTTDHCIPDLGGCVHTANREPCDDGDPCTINDKCSAKVCVGTPYSCPPVECMAQAVCDGVGGCDYIPAQNGTPCADDGNPCTLDVCEDGVCKHPAATNGTACDDGNLCSQSDQCIGGVCVGGDWVVCNVDDPCRDPGTCDPATGTCSAGVLGEGEACDDRNPCTTNDSCRNGACTGDPKVCQPLDDCHDAGTCDQITGLCSNPQKIDGTPCDDRDLCTQEDKCFGGVCTGLDPVVCPVPGQCQEDPVCNPATGTCPVVFVPNGTACDDSVACTKNDICTNGTCAGTAYTCSPPTGGGTCTKAFCDGEGGCGFTVNPGKCFINGTCRNANQANSKNYCQICDPSRSQTEWSNRDGLTCSDNDPCTFNDMCVDGYCTGTPYVCDNQGLSCVTSVCLGDGTCNTTITVGKCAIDGACWNVNALNPANTCESCQSSSQTSWTPRAQNSTCDDGNSCTHSDKCDGGVCVGIEYTCPGGDLDCTAPECDGLGGCSTPVIPGYCAIDGVCYQEGATDPANSCQVCHPGFSQISWAVKANDAPCDDGDPCTTGDKCSSGQCVGPLATCDDGLDCTTDFCDDGVCSYQVMTGWCAVNEACWQNGQTAPNNSCQICDTTQSVENWTDLTGVSCDDNSACTVNDVCVNGLCVGTEIDCDDELVCTLDSCDNGQCIHTIAPGYCFIDGACYTANSANPNNVCLKCNPTVAQRIWAFNNGAACDDGDACTKDDVCGLGNCVGQHYDCDDYKECTIDSCDGDGNCTHEIADGYCLIDGACVAAFEPHALLACKACLPLISKTEWSDLTSPCDDGDACTKNDVCQNGFCVGQPYTCDDQLDCTVDSCDGQGGCLNVTMNNSCLIEGVCYDAQTLNPANNCLICLPGMSQSTWQYNDGRPCDDNDLCTTSDKCFAGTCRGLPYECNDGLVCTDDFCTGDGGCTYQRKSGYCLIDGECFADLAVNPGNSCQQCDSDANPTGWFGTTGASCNDGNSCTLGDTCVAGECVGDLHPCDDGIECTANICDGSGGCTFPLASGWCRINGVCWPAGYPEPGVDCSACNPDVDPYNWTELSSSVQEVCNGVDDDCDGITDPEGSIGCTLYYVDFDNDGFGSMVVPPKCLCQADALYKTSVGGDCDDNNGNVYPGATEICDWDPITNDPIDNNCDGIANPENTNGCERFYLDVDGDGHGVPENYKCLCEATGNYRSLSPLDCDDNNPYAWIGNVEACDGYDNTCDGIVDPEGSQDCRYYFKDDDNDGYGDHYQPGKCLCAPNDVYVTETMGDCDDSNPNINPSMPELCNGLDDDCNGVIDDGIIEDMCPYDEGLGFELHGTMSCTSGQCVVTCFAPEDQGAWFDTDNNVYNGCECQADIHSLEGTHSDGTTARQLTPLEDKGDSIVVAGNLADTEADWWQVQAIDLTPLDEANGCDNFNFKVRFLTNEDDSFRFEVYKGGYLEGNLMCASATTYEWATNFADHVSKLGECDCSSYTGFHDAPEDYSACVAMAGAYNCGSGLGIGQPNKNQCSDNSAEFYIKVFAKPGASRSCPSYELEFSNGKYAFSGF